MNVAIDIDGVCLDFMDAFIALMERRLGRRLTLVKDCYDFSARFALPKPVCEAVFTDPAYIEFWENLPVMAGAVEAANRMAALGHTVHYVSGVPPLFADARRRQMERIGLDSSQLVVAHGADKASYFRRLDIDMVVDDDPLCLQAAAQAGVALIFHVREPRIAFADEPERGRILESLSEHYIAVNSLAEAVERVTPTLIGIRGAKEAGKDTVAGMLAQCGYKRLAFADKLKGEVSEAFDVSIDYLNDRQSKEIPDTKLALVNCKDADFLAQALAWVKSELGLDTDEQALRQPLSPRWVAQKWGTEYRRSQDRNYWVNRVREDILQAPLHGIDAICFSDLRFLNEYAMTRDWGGFVWRVRNRSAETAAAADSHPSEHELDGTPVDVELQNHDYDYDDLFRQVKARLAPATAPAPALSASG